MENSIKEKMVEVLKDTVQFYSKDPSRRARTLNGCEYFTSDGKMCAVGRYIKDAKGLQQLINKDAEQIKLQSFSSVSHLPGAELKEGLEEIPFYFWSTLQGIHDSCKNWDEQGLTAEGADRVRLAIKVHQLNTTVEEVVGK